MLLLYSMSDPKPGSLERFWKELKRRHVVQVATVYSMTAWLVIQFAVAIFPYLEFPKWSVTSVIVLAFVGFPIALIISWIYDLGPKGLVVTVPVEEEGAKGAPVGKRSVTGSVVIAGLAVLLVGQSFYFNHWRGDVAPVMAEATNELSLAVAVLPFVNMSSDADQEFFSDGLTEDIITQLAKIKDLHVIN